MIPPLLSKGQRFDLVSKLRNHHLGKQNLYVNTNSSEWGNDIWAVFENQEKNRHLCSRLTIAAQKLSHRVRLRSQYALRLYALAKKHVSDGRKRISLEQLRKVLGLESVKDAEGNVIQEAPLPIWANFRQRALDIAILDQQEDCYQHRSRTARTIKTSASDLGDFFDSGASRAGR